MKILHVLAQLPRLTGSGVYFSNVVEGLEDEHDQAVIFGYQGDFEFDLVEEENQYPVEFKTDKLDFPIVGMSDVMPYETTKYSELNCSMIESLEEAFKERILEATEEFKPDVIICHHLWMLTSLVVDLVDEDIKLVGACHGTDIRQCGRNPHLKEEYVRNIHKLDKVFALSELQVGEIAEEYGISEDKIVVMGGGFNQNIFYRDDSVNKEDKEEIDIVFAGKIDASKGVFQLAECFSQVQDQEPNAHLHIIGAPDEEAEKRLDSIISEGDNIRVYNVDNQAALGDKFRETDIFVLPSYFEGLGLVAIESLACGMRAVTTVIEGLQSLLGREVEKSGVIEYVDLPRLKNIDEPYEEDLEEYRDNLARAILLQIERHKEGQEISEKTRELIDSHSWKYIVEKMNKEIIKTYNE